MIAARRYRVTGRVQGVGFRPFVFRLAQAHGLHGWVRNLASTVEIVAQGELAVLARFARSLCTEAPPLARDVQVQDELLPAQSLRGFAILESTTAGLPEARLPPDAFVCDDCRRELHDPADRRYRYPFINCTQCGPRYTVITALPYDRANTALARFPLCAACRAEYINPAERRFHAEPLACPTCGPQLQYDSESTGRMDATDRALAAAVAALQRGAIVAVKGIGGYHLLCDARHDTAITRLRAVKPRPHKPLAVLFPWVGADGLDAVRAHAVPDAAAERALCAPDRPIVLVRWRRDSGLSRQLAPGLNELGALLPYSPLHHLLSSDFGAPLVATSANRGGEPVLTDNADVESRLALVADAFLHHDRPIVRPADDTVLRVIAGRARPLRLGRGQAPLELELPATLAAPTLAVGGHLKNSVALGVGRRVVISPHLTDLGSPRALSVFAQVIDDLQKLYGVQATRLACDAHPNYASTRWAHARGLPVTPVYHHRAHAAALAGEYPDVSDWLVFTWDGTGLGEDGTLWGGEAMHGRPGAWQRVASFRPFHLPGGEKAGREPWRTALALCWEAGLDWSGAPLDTALLRASWDRRLNAPATSAVGRLFDGAAALLGLNSISSYEGQAPMLLEAACSGVPAAVELPLARDAGGLWRSDWAPLLPMLCDTHIPAGERAAGFHASLAQALCAQAERLRDERGDVVVGLTGGVFQNRVLTEQAVQILTAKGFDVRLPQQLPGNDGGLCYGQIIELGARA